MLTELRERVPLISDERAEDLGKMYSQWLVISEAIRRELLENGEVREKLLAYVVQPVSQDVVRSFFRDFRNLTPRIASFFSRYKQVEEVFSSLPDVPEEYMQPDIRHGKLLIQPQKLTEALAMGYTEEYFNTVLQEQSERGVFEKGISISERKLASFRYRIARDIKLFALMAELSTNPIQPELNTPIFLTTPNGVELGGQLSDHSLTDLFSPEKWQARAQLKDRVYVITVGQDKYVLKEKKTNRHTDTMEGGHFPGVSSREEFQAAAHFSQHANKQFPDFELEWEKPIGYVEFPDGFQFVIFRYEEGLLSDGSRVTTKLSEVIQKHEPELKEEYLQVIQDASRFIGQQASIRPDKPRKTLFDILTGKIGRMDFSEYTFAQFARVKALFLKTVAWKVLVSEISSQEYTNRDADGYAFRVCDEPPFLTIIGMDFEYFHPENKASEQTETTRKQGNAKQPAIVFFQWDDKSRVLAKDELVYLAIREAWLKSNKPGSDDPQI